MLSTSRTWSAERLQEAADQLTAIARKILPPGQWTFSTDRADNRILECAAQATSEMKNLVSRAAEQV